MQHDTGKWPSMIATITTAALLGAFVAVYILDFSIVRMDWCGDASAGCLREWISALSGWVAALGAGIAAYLTIRAMASQIDEAKRQTDFVVGDSLPGLEIRPGYTRAENVYVEVTNWNRRQIEIVDASIAFYNLDLNCEYFSYEGEWGTEYIHAGERMDVMVVPGWRDRNSAPHTFAAFFCVVRGQPAGPAREYVQVQLKVRIAGMSPSEVEIWSDCHNITVW